MQLHKTLEFGFTRKMFIKTTILMVCMISLRNSAYPATLTENLDANGYNISNVGGFDAADIIVEGPWVDVRAYASFSAAIDSIGSTEKTLLIPNEQDVTANKTVPANITLLFLHGGFLDISNGVTITINGHVKAGLYQIFHWTGTGKVVFGDGAVKEVYPEWWGLKAQDDVNYADTNAVAFQAAVKSGCSNSLTVKLSNATFYLNPTNHTYDDGSYTYGVPVAVAIPDNVTIDGNNATIKSTGQSVDSYSIFASYNTINVHIKNLSIIGDRETHVGSGHEHGFNIDYRDVENSSVENVYSSEANGDGLYLGVIDTGGTGSNTVGFINCHSEHNRRQALSITGGQEITVLGGSYSWSDGTTPKSGIDIEPNTSAFVQDVKIIGAHFEGNVCPIISYKTNGLIIDGITTYDNARSFPMFADRVYNAVVSNSTFRAGNTTQYGILWQDVLDLKNILIKNNILDGASICLFYINDTTGHEAYNIQMDNNIFIFSDAAIYGSSFGVRATVLDRSGMNNNRFIIPSGFDSGDLTNLDIEGGRRFILSCNVPHSNNVFDNQSSTLTSANLSIRSTFASNQGNRYNNIYQYLEALSLSNGWTAAGGSYLTPSYQKTSTGTIRLFGAITGGTTTTGTTITTLPSGFRPAASITLPVSAWNGTAYVATSVVIASDGTVKTCAGFVNSIVSLDGLSFVGQ